VLPATVCSKLCSLTPEDGVELLLKTAAAAHCDAAVKTAAPKFLQELITPTSGTSHVARNALLGAGLGGVVGGIREANKPEAERRTGRGITQGILTGGLLGGGLTAGYVGMQGQKTTDPDLLKQERIAAHQAAQFERAQNEALRHKGVLVDGKPVNVTNPGPSADLTPMQNFLNSSALPPALRAGLTDPSGPAVGLATTLPANLSGSDYAIGGLPGAAAGTWIGHHLGEHAAKPYNVRALDAAGKPADGFRGAMSAKSPLRIFGGGKAAPAVRYGSKGLGLGVGTILGGLLTQWARTLGND